MKSVVFFFGFIVPVLVLGVGCEQKSRTVVSGTNTGGSGEGWFAGRNFSEHFDIEYADIDLDGNRDYNRGDEWVKKWTSTFNVTFDVIPLTREDRAERSRIWLNSGDAPDMIVLSYNHGEAVNYVDQELVKRLPDGWKTKYPSLAKAYSDTPMSALAEESFGGTYFLYRPMYANNRPTQKLSTHVSLYLRKDWGEAAGVPVQPTMKLSEIFDWARQIKAVNPGKVAGTFTPIVNRPGWIGFYVHFNNAYAGIQGPPYYKGQDGKYHWGPGDESTLEALKMLNAAYQEGLIHQEFYTLKDPDDYGAFYTIGSSAAAIGNGMAWKMAEIDQHLSVDMGLKYDDIVEVVTVLGEDGKFHGVPEPNYWGVIAFSPNISDKKLDRILQMLDYSCTDEGQLEIRCGIKGVDWELDANNEIISKLPPNVTLWDKYALYALYVNMMILSDDFQFRDPNYRLEFRNKTRELYEVRQMNGTDITFPLNPDWNVLLHRSQALNQASMAYADEYASLIIKNGDIEANWRAWVREKMPLIQPVLNELNAKL